MGSQANRLEPIFEDEPYASLVPKLIINYDDGKKWISILQVGHRLGDALVRCTELADEVKKAFITYLDCGDASSIARLAPTSLVFGVWDSRGTQAKLPRIVQSNIRAWDVDKLTRSAQYSPPVNYAELGAFSEAEQEKAEMEGIRKKNSHAQRGFVHVPAVGEHGGILVNGEIRRTITINLVALRYLRCEESWALRRYVLGLSLVSATAPFDSFLRQGCHLTPDPDTRAVWMAVARDGTREEVTLDAEDVLNFARDAAKKFGVGGDHKVSFKKEKAKKDEKKT